MQVAVRVIAALGAAIALVAQICVVIVVDRDELAEIRRSVERRL